MNSPLPLPQQLSPSLFWDVKVEQLDLQLHAGYIIPRVMDYGSWEEVRFIWKHYGIQRIREHLLAAPSLHKRTIHFFAWYFKLPLDSFKAWRQKQNCPTWNR